MKVFGYGSLLNRSSIIGTPDSLRIIGPDSLNGYKRVFNFKSPYRRNPETGVYSSVLNLVQSTNVSVFGLVFEVDVESEASLLEREVGYEILPVTLGSGKEVSTFISRYHTPYGYVFKDLIQEEYLSICLKGARKLGNEVYENFLDTTYIADSTVRTYLHLKQKTDS